MSKTFARSSLCALSMTIMTAHAAEPPTNLDKPEGRLDIIAWPGYIERGQTDKQYDCNAVRKRDRLRGECENRRDFR